MQKWTCEAVARITNGTLIGNANLEVHGCVLDSRKAEAGEMFFALPGEKVDGHDYIDLAWKNGAVLAIAEETRLKQKEGLVVPEGRALLLVPSVFKALQELAAAWRLALGARVVGITGSNGKTTTKDMVAAVLAQRFNVYYNKENQNNELGLPLTILNAPVDTEILILEMGMRGLGQIKALCEIAKPDLGIITNIGTTHMELLGTQEHIAQAKWELIEALPEEGMAILNAEDAWSVQKSKTNCHSKRFYGLKGTFAQPHIKGDHLQPLGILGTTFNVRFQDEQSEALLPLPGEHNVLDALAALAVGTVLGISLADGCKGLTELELSKMRLEIRQGLLETTLISDVYNANPISMQASLRVLVERAERNKTLAILGEMYELGSAAESGHRDVGKAVAQLRVSELITVGKLAESIAQGALAEGFSREHIHVTATKEEAVQKARERLNRLGVGTWVLIKGSRGMKMEEITTHLERTE